VLARHVVLREYAVKSQPSIPSVPAMHVGFFELRPSRFQDASCSPSVPLWIAAALHYCAAFLYYVSARRVFPAVLIGRASPLQGLRGLLVARRARVRRPVLTPPAPHARHVSSVFVLERVADLMVRRSGSMSRE